MRLPASVGSRRRLFPYLGIGIGLRREHYAHVLENRPEVDWFEAISENFMGTTRGSGGRPLRVLKAVAENYEVALHGVSLSLGSVDPIDEGYLGKLAALCSVTRPPWVSDHLCWTGVEGENLHDLLPLPQTEEAVALVTSRIVRVQSRLARPFLLENISSYVTFRHSEMREWEFLTAIAERADCGILLDINNIYVNSQNHGFDPLEYLRGIDPSRVGQFHLAGHRRREGFLVDTHDAPVCDEVWALYAEAVKRFGRVSTLIEWDGDVPSFERLEQEAAKARQIQESVLGNERPFDRSYPG